MGVISPDFDGIFVAAGCAGDADMQTTVPSDSWIDWTTMFHPCPRVGE
jgi:hypothetical protein